MNVRILAVRLTESDGVCKVDVLSSRHTSHLLSLELNAASTFEGSSFREGLAKLGTIIDTEERTGL